MRTRRALLFLIGALLVAGQVAGENRWGGFIGAATDSIYRSESQTRGRPALQTDLHYELLPQTLVGGFVSAAEASDGLGTPFELDAYAAKAWALSNDWRARLALVHYAYFGADRGPGPDDFDEVIVSLGYRDRLVATVAGSPNLSRYSLDESTARRSAVSYELAARWPLAQPWNVSAGAGYYDLSNFLRTGYWFWSAGIDFEVRNYRAELSCFGADATARKWVQDAARSRWVLTVAWLF